MPTLTEKTAAATRRILAGGGIPDGAWAYHNGGKDTIIKRRLVKAGATKMQSYALGLTALHLADGDLELATQAARDALPLLSEETNA